MALSWQNLKTRHDDKAPRLLIHGQPKTGKTTFACSAPNPLVLATEDGLGRTKELAEVPAFHVTSWDQAMEAIDLFIDAATKGEPYFGTLVIDSLDHLEPLCFAKVCAREKVDSIEKIGYGKGFTFALDLWREQYNKRVRYIQKKLKRMVIEICHSHPSKENPPDMIQGFTRWTPKLSKGIVELMKEDADGIFYLSQPIITHEAQGAFGTTNTKAAAVGDRRLHLLPGGGYLAGSRWEMPEFVPAKWASLEPYLTGVPERR